MIKQVMMGECGRTRMIEEEFLGFSGEIGKEEED